MIHKLQFSPWILLTLLACLLSGCGFQLAGKSSLPPQLEHVAVVSQLTYDPYSRDLRESLITAGAKVVDNPEEADTVINVLEVQKGSNMTATGATQETRAYRLTYMVKFNIEDAKGNVLYKPVTLTTSATHYVYAGEVLGNNQETTTVYQSLRREAVLKTMYLLSSEHTRDALATRTASPETTE